MKTVIHRRLRLRTAVLTLLVAFTFALATPSCTVYGPHHHHHEGPEYRKPKKPKHKPKKEKKHRKHHKDD